MNSIISRARELDEAIQQDYVHKIVFTLLWRLYSDLFELEKNLTKYVERDKEGITTFSKLVFLGEEQKIIEPRRKIETYFVQGTRSGLIQGHEVVQWIDKIYFQNRRYRKIVGPVGERPIHVCFLFANMFSIHDKIRKGILDAVKSFVHFSACQVSQLKVPCSIIPQGYCFAELKVPYGKDYCAALGTIICSNGLSQMRENTPPFSRLLEKWVRDHNAKTHIEGESESALDSRVLVTAGLYEGETVLHFPITSKDLDTVNWLLDNGLGCGELGAANRFLSIEGSTDRFLGQRSRPQVGWRLAGRRRQASGRAVFSTPSKALGAKRYSRHHSQKSCHQRTCCINACLFWAEADFLRREVLLITISEWTELWKT